MKNFLAGCVILYNPSSNVLDNIASYIDGLDKLFVVDNANGQETIVQLKQKYNDKINAICYEENQGIAKPLNDVLRMCDDEYDYLLTMDQDSRFLDGCFEKYCEEIIKFDWSKTLMLGVCTVREGQEINDKGSIAWNRVYRKITSGSVVDVKKALEIGGFDETLFIDEVDHEFCYRGYVKKGYCVYAAQNSIYLLHHLGNEIQKLILYRNFAAMNHNYIRKYYIIRNRLYVYSQYHSIDEKYFFKEYLRANLREYFSVLFIERDDKFRKFKYMCLGIKDFVIGRKGKVY